MADVPVAGLVPKTPLGAADCSSIDVDRPKTLAVPLVDGVIMVEGLPKMLEEVPWAVVDADADGGVARKLKLGGLVTSLLKNDVGC